MATVFSFPRVPLVLFLWAVADVAFVILILNLLYFDEVLIVVVLVGGVVVVALLVLYFLFEKCHSIVAAVAAGLSLVAVTSL